MLESRGKIKQGKYLHDTVQVRIMQNQNKVIQAKKNPTVVEISKYVHFTLKTIWETLICSNLPGQWRTRVKKFSWIVNRKVRDKFPAKIFTI